MILYAAFTVLLSMFFTSTSALFAPMFDLMGIGPGLRTVVVQAGLLGIAMLVMFRQAPSGLLRDLLRSLAVWLPWLIYAAIRTDFSDNYASVYFGKIVVIQFMSVIALTIVYRAKPKDFDRYFIPTMVILGIALVAKTLLDPDVFLYAAVIERTTIEGANPIWLARSFAVAAVCVMFLPLRPSLRIAGVVLFGIAMIPTGSRGPLIALIVVALLYLSMNYFRREKLLPIIVAGGLVAVVVGLLAGPMLSDFVAGYFSRGTMAGGLEESGRPQLFALALREFMSSPLVGVGLGQFGRSILPLGLTSVGHYYPHNMILEVLGTLGAIGLLLFVAALRPGRWMIAPNGIYFYLFLISAIFSMSSGDLVGNSGVIFFGLLARLEYLRRGSERARRQAIRAAAQQERESESAGTENHADSGREAPSNA